MEVIFFVGLFIVVIVAIQTIGDIVKRKYQFETEPMLVRTRSRKSKQTSMRSKRVSMK